MLLDICTKLCPVLNPDYVESIPASNLSCLWMPRVRLGSSISLSGFLFFSPVPPLIPVQLLSGGYVPHPSSHQLYPEFPEPYCIMRKYWSCRVWCGCLSTLMGVIQCVGSMLLSLVGLVYGCVVFILENQSLAPTVFGNVIASVSDHFNSTWMSQES